MITQLLVYLGDFSICVLFIANLAYNMNVMSSEISNVIAAQQIYISPKSRNKSEALWWQKVKGCLSWVLVPSGLVEYIVYRVKWVIIGCVVCHFYHLIALHIVVFLQLFVDSLCYFLPVIHRHCWC